MAHCFFIDHIDKLVIKKDSTILLATTLKNMGEEVYVLFEDDFYIDNYNNSQIDIYEFESILEDDQIHIKNFKLTKQKQIQLSENDTIHMRLDPPFDTRYLRILWMLEFLAKKTGAVILNNPQGIMLNNEKILAFEQTNSLDSFIGNSVNGFVKFLDDSLKQDIKSIILKPLDLYQGIGVERVFITHKNINEVVTIFKNKSEKLNGAIIAQHFDESIFEGEVRSLYFDGIELGSILKVPQKNNFLANIAQGATYKKYILNKVQENSCNIVAESLRNHGVRFIAFDLLGDNLSEVNITCPGLLVEVSSAFTENLAMKICDKLI